jgi:outer membrane cobalamin receptor
VPTFKLLFFVGLLLFSREGLAEIEPRDRFSDLNLEQLMDVSVSVTSEKAQSLRSAPGVVSVITSEDIKNSGARDLTDVLRLIPGLTFNGEVQTTIALSFRGIYANEGKILLRLDGQDWNELGYSNFTVGDRLPVEMIDRIEIIRGPGSVRFGGWAEIAVIDIHTKNHKQTKGLHLATSGGALVDQPDGRRTVSVGFSETFSSNAGVSVSYYMGRTRLSDRTYYSLSSVSTDMRLTEQQPNIFNLAANLSGWKLRLIRENYAIDQATGPGTPFSSNSSSMFSSLLGELSFDGKINVDWSYRVGHRYTQQRPWLQTNPIILGTNSYYDKLYERGTTSILLKNSETSSSFFSIGAEYRADRGHVESAPEANNVNLFFPTSASPTDTMRQTAYAVYSETIQQTDFGNFSAGIRHEATSNYPASTVPRFAFTKIIDTWHTKALLSWAYRAPTFENFSLNPTVRPETTRTIEFEVGKRLNSEQQFTLALFDTQIHDAIIYSTFNFNGQQVDGYNNLNRTGARGMEAEWRLRKNSLTADAAWTFASSRGLNDVSQYSSGDDDLLLGVPRNKVILRTAWNFATDWWLSPSLVWQSETKAWAPDSATGAISDYPSTSHAALALRRDNLLMKNLNLTAGGANLFNQNLPYLVAYRSDGSDLAALPGPSREFYGRLEYNVDF